METIKKEDLDLSNVSRTMFLTMLARARETEREGGIVNDPMAVQMAKKIDGVFPVQKGDWKTETGVIVRTSVIDDYVMEFIEKHPDAVCINFGCGLDTRFHRVNNGKIKWYDIDLPAAIAVRKKLIGEVKNVTMLGYDLFAGEWMQHIETEDRPVLVIVEGLLMYFKEAEVKKALDLIYDKFQKAHLVIEVLSDRVVGKENASIKETGSKFKWGVSSGKDVEKLNSHYHFIKETNLVERMQLKMKIYKVIAKIPAIANLSNRIAVFDMD